jgi:hypothetical protein
MGELFSCETIGGAEILAKMLFIAISLSAAAAFHLSTALTGLMEKKKDLIGLLYICAIFVSLTRKLPSADSPRQKRKLRILMLRSRNFLGLLPAAP